ncbi:hypothetical protein GCM10025780_21370 [Frondihabitans cladoniiphilus]|uniref:Uncharacterized protein n=1 Tax=Frondihabitans cladoniiphilus TaxID=715785 RepID=A0ABP8W262_9MICO
MAGGVRLRGTRVRLRGAGVRLRGAGVRLRGTGVPLPHRTAPHRAARRTDQRLTAPRPTTRV